MSRMKHAESRYIEVQLTNVCLQRSGCSVLAEVSWRIRPRERWVLVGANGAGKTQLLKLIAGAVWPTPSPVEQRRYVWQGESWRTPQGIQEEIGYLGPERQDKYERYGWNHCVERVVGTGLHRTDIPLNELTPGDRRSIRLVLTRLGLSSLTQRPFLSLSYGERRLTLLARALASKPKLLLLDELLNGLDRINHRRALRWLDSTSRSPLPWVISTHRVEDVPRSTTHALVLEQGRVAYRGPLRGAPLKRWLDYIPPRRARPQRSRRRSAGGELLVRLANASVYLNYQRVLESLSLEIRAGECWVVHGRNGSGKSTFLRTLYGDHGVAHGGRIERTGIEPGVPLEEFKRRVGLVAPHLQAEHPQHLTVAEVVQSGRYASVGLNEPPSPGDRLAAARSLAFFGLSALGSRALREISYGQLRRVLFARAWVGRPQLLLLDEPFSGVDAPTRGALMDHIEAMAAGGAAIVMATHHLQEWPTCATHELELVRGRARHCGPLRIASRVPRLRAGAR